MFSDKQSVRSFSQASNQLGTPSGAKCFLRGAQIFKIMSNSFKQFPTHFSRVGENFFKGAGPLPDYGPGFKPTTF